MLEEKTIKLLKKAGWYENRKINIENQVKVLEDNGYEVFDEAKMFLEKFGELHIIAKYIDDFDDEEGYDDYSTCYENLKGSYKRRLNYDDKVGEKTIPVCKLYHGEYTVCISETGKLFVSEGMWAIDSNNLWNGLLGEYKGGFLDWIDYKACKEFKRSKYKNKNGYFA